MNTLSNIENGIEKVQNIFKSKIEKNTENQNEEEKII